MSNGRMKNYYLRYFGTVHWSQYRIFGIVRIREQWILDRNDEELSEISSEWKAYMTKADHLRFGIYKTDAC
jgi:hypothetical protein